MESSMMVARILGVVYLAFALGLIFDWRRYKDVILELIDSTAYLVLGGMIAIILGVIILSLQPGITSDWTVLLPIIGWAAILKGVFLISFPKSMVIYKSFLEWSGARLTMMIMTLGVGLLFLYYGFLS